MAHDGTNAFPEKLGKLAKKLRWAPILGGLIAVVLWTNAGAILISLVASWGFDPDGVIHYSGSPTVAMPLESHWLFRQDVGTVVSTELRRYKPGDVTPYIKIASGRGEIIPVCPDCTNDELDFRDGSQNRIGKLECDPSPPAGVSCFGYKPSRGARVRFLPDPNNPYRTYNFGVDVRRNS